MARELRLLTIPEVLRMANGSVDFPGMRGGIDWGQLFAGKVAHSHFDALVDEIMENGFGMPIVLCDRQDGRGYVIGNGHHRLCAAILLGLWRIPVMVSEGRDRTDFMCNRDSADDYGRPISGSSHDYWDLMESHVPYGHVAADENVRADALGYLHADTDDETDNGSFFCGDCDQPYRVSDYCCLECHDAAEHQSKCERCENAQSDCVCFLIDVERWQNMGWHYGVCLDCGNYGYAMNHGACAIDRDHDDALDEHYGWQAERANLIRVGALLPDGAWHPVSVLSEAYAMHAEWEEGAADRAMAAAREAWQAAVQAVRDAVRDGAGPWFLSSLCEAAAARRNEFEAL